MKITSLATVCSLMLALLLFAQHRPQNTAQPMFSAVIDASAAQAKKSSDSGTLLQAPARYARGGWSADAIPTNRLIAPLVLLDIRGKCWSNSCEAGMDDVAKWETANGRIPAGAVVVANTGLALRNPDKHVAHFSLEAARFLVEGRSVFGIGMDTADLGTDTEKYSALQNVFVLQNVSELGQAPNAGAIVVVAPTKLTAAETVPARLLVLVKKPS